MHLFWFSLFIKIIISIISGAPPTEAGADVYEGDSGSEDEGEKKEKKK